MTYRDERELGWQGIIWRASDALEEAKHMTDHERMMLEEAFAICDGKSMKLPTILNLKAMRNEILRRRIKTLTQAEVDRQAHAAAAAPTV